MILFTLNQTFSRIKLVHFLAIAAIMVGSVFAIDYIRQSDSRAVLEKSRQEFNQSQTAQKTLLVQEQEKINLNKEAEIKKQKMRLCQRLLQNK